MAKTVQVKKYFTFVGGLNTEASPLNYPPNTWAEGDNVIPSADGSISLRLAMDYESGYALSSAQTAAQESNGAYVTGEWNNVAGDGNRNFLVVQRDKEVSFYVNSGAGVSGQAKGFTIDLTTYKAPGNPESHGVAPISVANAQGRLIVVSRDIEPLLVTYNPDDDTISISAITIQIRDFISVDDGLDVDERPVSLSAAHNYNLLNQGWTTTHINAYQSGSGYYPSNAQSWTAGKDSSDNFSQALLDKQDFGTSPAPRGRFVLNAFSRDRTTASGVSGLTTETESYRPTTCAFYAGRAWYAGVRSSTIGTWVMFSQVAETEDNLGKCYQDADPTSEVVSDLVASDGGVIPIQDAGTVLRLLPHQDSMLVVCDNGVWQIKGGLQSGFAADGYEVKKLSSFGAVSPRSLVVTEIGVLYWGDEAIYAIAPDQVGELRVSALTPGVIQTLYDNIPMTGKVYSSGAYFASEGVVYWLYNDDDSQNGIQYRFKKNRILCLDTNLKAFYTFTVASLASLSPYLTDVFVTKSRSKSSVTDDVVDGNGDPVTDGSGGPVTAVITPDVTAATVSIKFLTCVPQLGGGVKTTVAGFSEAADAPAKLRDWYTADSAGITYSGYMAPGYDFGEDQGGDRNIQALYVLVYMRRTETGIDANGDPVNPSSCLMQGKWDFSDTSASNKWSSQQEVYRHRRLWLPSFPVSTFDDGYPVVMTKNKVRGKGKALQLKFTSSADKDMQILGWAITYIGNANV